VSDRLTVLSDLTNFRNKDRKRNKDRSESECLIRQSDRILTTSADLEAKVKEESQEEHWCGVEMSYDSVAGHYEVSGHSVCAFSK